jgi:glycosyltransferase involved in cell wall biosynthesis
MMNIYAICLVKDEADIIAQTLMAAKSWVDAVFVYDNGSTDGTWEKVTALAATEPHVVPYKSDPKTFSDAMRREVFVDYRQRCRAGDWWCKLDSDEIYPEDPREFLQRVPLYYQIVWSVSIQFVLTDADLRAFDQNPAGYADDVPVAQKMRYYKTDWSEARFFRYDPALKWPEGHAFPAAGAVYPKRILMKHYKHRSPQQVQRRVDVRAAAVQSGSAAFLHERGRENWRDHVKPAAEMDYDHHDGRFVVREELMPALPITSRMPPRLVNALRDVKRFLR